MQAPTNTDPKHAVASPMPFSSMRPNPREGSASPSLIRRFTALSFVVVGSIGLLICGWRWYLARKTPTENSELGLRAADGGGVLPVNQQAPPSTPEARVEGGSAFIGDFRFFNTKEEKDALYSQGFVEITVGRESSSVNYDFGRVLPITFDRALGELSASIPVGSLILIRVTYAPLRVEETCVIYEGGTIVSYLYPEGYLGSRTDPASVGFQGSLALFLPENSVVFGYIEPQQAN